MPRKLTLPERIEAWCAKEFGNPEVASLAAADLIDAASGTTQATPFCANALYAIFPESPVFGVNGSHWD